MNSLRPSGSHTSDSTRFSKAFASLLPENPSDFDESLGTQLSIIKTPVYPDAPSLRIFFTYNEEEVHLLTVEFCEDDVAPTVGFEE